jgi:hypothetical protein
MKSWRNAHSSLASDAIPNHWLHDTLGLVDLTRQRMGLYVPIF